MPKELDIKGMSDMSSDELNKQFTSKSVKKTHIVSDPVENSLYPDGTYESSFIDWSFSELQLKSDVQSGHEKAMTALVEAKRLETLKAEETILKERLRVLKESKEDKPELYQLCVETLDRIFDKDWEADNKEDYDPEGSVDIDL